MRWFGPKAFAPICSVTPQIPTPVGEICAVCHKIIREGYPGFTIPLVSRQGNPPELSYHHRCFLRTVLPPHMMPPEPGPPNVREHIPDFVSGPEPQAARAQTLFDLIEIPWIARWHEQPEFKSWAIGDGRLLIAVLQDTHWVVAYLDQPELYGLPEWKR